MRFETVALLWMLWHVLIVGGILVWFGMGTPGSWAEFRAVARKCMHSAVPHGHHAR